MTTTTISTDQLLGQLHWRYATKQFDPTRQISATDWTALEEALLLSPSSGGLQPWGFLRGRRSGHAAEDAEVLVRPNESGRGLAPGGVSPRGPRGRGDVDAHVARTAEVRGVPVESMKEFRGMLVGGIVNAMDASARNWPGRDVRWASRLGNFLTSAALLGIDACPMEGFQPAQNTMDTRPERKGLHVARALHAGLSRATPTATQAGQGALPKGEDHLPRLTSEPKNEFSQSREARKLGPHTENAGKHGVFLECDPDYYMDGNDDRIGTVRFVIVSARRLNKFA